MILLYRVLTLLAYSLLYPYARLKAAAGSELWCGRLGLTDHQAECDIWIHAASVGEVKVISYLIDYLKNLRPQQAIHATVMTRTGMATATGLFGHQASISFLPLDCTVPIKKSIERIRPKIILIAETEIWPNFICEASRSGIRIIQINGRMSAGAFSRYRFIRSTLSEILGSYDRLFLKTKIDSERYSFFGVSSEKVEIVGDMKFDAPMTSVPEERSEEIRRQAGVSPGDFLIVAGSTRPGEEAVLIEAFSILRRTHSALKMIIAPRHLERIGEVKSLLVDRHIPFSALGRPTDNASITLLDRMGILNEVYAAADLAFVGGTLVEVGGHNILEPVWAGTPVVYGPYTANVADAAEYIERHDYGGRVESAGRLAELLDDVISGRKVFSVKTVNVLKDSPTARVGEYVLSRLDNA
jgi:3-deoxy-D-manno-octulosonic-acid transferase